MNIDELRKNIGDRKVKEEILHIDDWNADVSIKELTGQRLIYLSKLCTKNAKMDEDMFYTHAIIESVYLNNEKVFTVKDFDMVSALPAEVYSVLMNKIVILNNIVGASNSKN